MISLNYIYFNQLLATGRFYICITSSQNDLCPNPFLIRSRGPHHLSIIYQPHHEVSQRRYEYTSFMWPESPQSHWSDQLKPSHGSVVPPQYRHTPPSSQLYTLILYARPHVCLIRILPQPTPQLWIQVFFLHLSYSTALHIVTTSPLLFRTSTRTPHIHKRDTHPTASLHAALLLHPYLDEL
jgi:hypothetical protein